VNIVGEVEMEHEETPNDATREGMPIRITNKACNEIYVRISRGFGGGSNDFFRIGYGETETWHRVPLMSVEIEISNGIHVYASKRFTVPLPGISVDYYSPDSLDEL
jgi:hypothetical protein